MKSKTNNFNKEKILFVCSAKIDYTRNEFIISLLEKKYLVNKIYSNKNNYFSRLTIVYWQFLKLKNKQQYKFIFVGLTAQVLLPIVRLFYKKKIIADFFISLYDTLCFDRKTILANSLIGKSIFKFEKWTTSLADTWLVDTEQNKKYLSATYKVNSNSIKVLRVFANDKIFYPREIKSDTPRCDVFFYGSCQPLQGVPIILEAANILKEENIKFTLIGPIRKKYPKLIAKYDLSNVKLIDYVPYHELAKYISGAKVCLGGPFGNTDKAKRVITGKTYQFAAMKKTLILGDTLANHELFNEDNICFVPLNNALALSKSIFHLLNNLNQSNSLIENCYQLLKKKKKKSNI